MFSKLLMRLSNRDFSYIFSLRAMCGIDSEKNCVHGSDSPQSAQREISFFFKEMSAGKILFSCRKIGVNVNLPTFGL